MANKSNAAKIDSPVNETETVESEKKRSASKSLYVNANGETTRSPTAETETIRFVFDGFESDPVDLPLINLSAEMSHLAICQGVNIKLQRSYNTAKGNAAQMKEECEATRDNLLNDIWTSEREGGLRVGDLGEAIRLTLIDEGETVDDARMAKIKETLKDEAKRDKAKASPKVKAHLATIAAAKAAARAKTANENAGSAASGIGSDF